MEEKKGDKVEGSEPDEDSEPGSEDEADDLDITKPRQFGKKKLNEEEKRARLSFVEGYKHMTADDWMKVMFADEKKFKGDGFMGQIWVRRPKGEADNPAYQVQKLPHPVKLNVWGCFCGRGLGYC